MVQELITNQNKNAAVDLDLSGMGDKINQDIQSSGDSEDKPIIETPLLAQVKEISLKRDTELKFNQNDSSKKFYKIRLIVTTEFEKDGEKISSKDAYGGLRFYPLLNDGAPVLDEHGQPILDRFWSNSATSDFASYFSKLLDAAQKYDDSITSYGSFFNFLKTQPKCKILTEFTSVGGRSKQTRKQVIKEFIQ